MLMVFRLFDPVAAVLTAAGPSAADPLASQVPKLRTDTDDTVPPLLPGDPCMMEHCGARFAGGEYGYTVTYPADPHRVCWRHIRGLSGPVMEPNRRRRRLPTGASADTTGGTTSSPAESANGAGQAAQASSPASEPAELTEMIRAAAKAAWDDYFAGTAVDPWDQADEEDQAQWIRTNTVPVTAAYERLLTIRNTTEEHAR